MSPCRTLVAFASLRLGHKEAELSGQKEDILGRPTGKWAEYWLHKNKRSLLKLFNRH